MFSQCMHIRLFTIKYSLMLMQPHFVTAYKSVHSLIANSDFGDYKSHIISSSSMKAM